MKLWNKKTGEIGYLIPSKDIDKFIVRNEDWHSSGEYTSLAELTAEWEDYEERKEYWCITGRGNLHYLQDMTDENDKDHREIGNYFETKEEAELVVRKLKAWKRLKDKGFRFDGTSTRDRGKITEYEIYCDTGHEYMSKSDFTDLNLLFGGEE